MIKNLNSDELSEYDRITAFVRRAVESSRNVTVTEDNDNAALSVLERNN